MRHAHKAKTTSKKMMATDDVDGKKKSTKRTWAQECPILINLISGWTKKA